MLLHCFSNEFPPYLTSYCVAGSFTWSCRWFRKCQSRGSPLTPQKVDISLGNAKVEVAPPPIPPALHLDVVVCIDHREYFTTEHRFVTWNDFLEWVREEARKLGFSTVIGKSDKGGNGRSAFVTMICERWGSYTEYKKLTQYKIFDSVKCECLSRLRGFCWFGDWSFRVGESRHNHDLRSGRLLTPRINRHRFHR